MGKEKRMNSDRFEGLFVPMVVPFNKDESIDEAALRDEARFLLGTGLDGISSGGTTGEGALLSDAELLRCLELIQEENTAPKPVIAGIIRNSTREVIPAALDAKAAGADALLITPVFYNSATPEGNYEFFRDIAKAAGLPIIIYNVVSTNIISPELFFRIAEIDEVIGIKQVDPVKLAEIAAVCPDNKKVWAASDQLLYSCYVAGASGAISALLTIAPELCVKQWQAFKQGDQSTAMQIQKMLNPVVSLYLERPFPAKIKELIQLQGRNAGIARRPTLPSDPEVLEIMKRALAGAGLRVLQA